MICVARGWEAEVVSKIAQLPRFALDCETYGLSWEDPMFSLIIGTDKEQYYFNFNENADHLGKHPPDHLILEKRMVFHLFDIYHVFEDPTKLIYMHNAKFDLRRVEIDYQKPVECGIHDTMVAARVLKNHHLDYSLEAVGARYGFEKDKSVDDYIVAHKLYDWIHIPGKATREKNKKFYLVPFDMITKYGCRDAEITYQIGERQRDELSLS